MCGVHKTILQGQELNCFASVSFSLSFLLLKVYMNILDVSEWVCFISYIQHLNNCIFLTKKSTVSPVQYFLI